jgi:acyl-CoA reductase-like NAD-dependent aldehyde dehydrogenase
VADQVEPALAAGNTVVLKPASATPLTAIRLVEAFADAGLPHGYLNLVVGPGGEVGEALLHDPRPALYTFTGSAAVGQHLRESVGLRRTILELGSNSATIVHADADLEKAATVTARGAFAFAGQVCISVQRLLVHESIRERFTSLFVGVVRNLALGDPLDESTDVGPMIDEDAARRAESWIEEARAGGARVLCGGERHGSMVQPAVIADPKPTMKVLCQEVFAPVVTIQSYADIDEAISLANDSEYGLQAGLFTQDIGVMWRCADELEVGGLIVNDSSVYRADLMPYGGVKNSGIGREGPRYAVEEMTDSKVVVFNL